MKLVSIEKQARKGDYETYRMHFDGGIQKVLCYGGVVEKLYGKQMLGYAAAKAILEAFRDEAYSNGWMDAARKVRGDLPEVIEAVKKAKELLESC